MKCVFELGNRYAKKSNWKDFALTKFCLCSLGVIIGTFVPKKKNGLARSIAGSVFGVTYVMLMKKVSQLLLCICTMCMLLVGYGQIASADVSTAYFKDDDNLSIESVTINETVDYYQVHLPSGWRYYDDDLIIRSSNEDVAYFDVDRDEPNCICLCINGDVPYTEYIPVTITATKTDEEGNQKVAVLNVQRERMLLGFRSKTLYVGDKCTIQFQHIAKNPSKSAKFKSYDEDVATVSSDGVITAKGKGSTSIAVRAANNNSTFDLVEVNVKALPKMSKSKASIYPSETVKLSVKSLPKGTSVSWSTSDSSIAKVKSGTVTPVKPGKVTIKAKYKLNGSSHTVKCTVTVKKPKLSKTSLKLRSYMSKKLTITGGTGKVTWTSSDKSVATVSDGKITAKKAGSCTIKAKVNGVSLSCKLTVAKNQHTYDVVKRAGYYNDADDYFETSKIYYNSDKSITVEGYFINTHIYDIVCLDYLHYEIRDNNDKLIAKYTTPKIKKFIGSYGVKKIAFTIPASKVKKVVDLSQNLDLDWDYVFTYEW